MSQICHALGEDMDRDGVAIAILEFLSFKSNSLHLRVNIRYKNSQNNLIYYIYEIINVRMMPSKRQPMESVMRKMLVIELGSIKRSYSMEYDDMIGGIIK